MKSAQIWKTNMNSIADLRRQAACEELTAQGWLRHLEWRPEVDSTNSLAKRWYSQNSLETPALFVADQQTAGRGRSGNEWWSPSGCLMLTLVIPINELPSEPSLHPQLALVAGVAIAATVDELIGNEAILPTQLKWPNDAYLSGRKLAGILIEALQSQSQSQTTGFAIGVGINTQVDWRDAPEQLRERAVCLSTAVGRSFDCETVLVELVQQIREKLAAWRERPDDWLATWRRRCLLTGCVVTARVGGSCEIVGRCEGIDIDGRLLLRSENQLHTLTACEILHWT
jgi:BirA family transcriptional regulator, biotin operon repressor / biotin---[acetyl-CoA-carboxylase] ligase